MENENSLMLNKINNGSNHNIFAHVVRSKTKIFICGTSFNDNSNIDIITEWANNRLLKYDRVNDCFKESDLLLR